MERFVQHGSQKIQGTYFAPINLMERDGRAVALKICANDYQGANQEVEILSYAKHHAPLNDFVVELLDHFHLTGPNGEHLCLVLELMWSNVAFFIAPFQDDLQTRLKIVPELMKRCISILEALEKHNIVHNGMAPP
jgi:serine/threonine-protein kinase SRPK3